MSSGCNSTAIVSESGWLEPGIPTLSSNSSVASHTWAKNDATGVPAEPISAICSRENRASLTVKGSQGITVMSKPASNTIFAASGST